jgi:hypothetical protein
MVQAEAFPMLQIQSAHAIVVADPGIVRDRALILDPLRTAGVSPQDVTHIFISHHHPDHTVNITLFPNGDLWHNHGDGYEMTPGVTVLRTPSHTEEDASLADARGVIIPMETPQAARELDDVELQPQGAVQPGALPPTGPGRSVHLLYTGRVCNTAMPGQPSALSRASDGKRDSPKKAGLRMHLKGR